MQFTKLSKRVAVAVATVATCTASFGVSCAVGIGITYGGVAVSTGKSAGLSPNSPVPPPKKCRESPQLCNR